MRYENKNEEERNYRIIIAVISMLIGLIFVFLGEYKIISRGLEAGFSLLFCGFIPGSIYLYKYIKQRRITEKD